MSERDESQSSERSPRARLDLNLLEPLGVFLEERSVSMAAVRLRVSQPTASNLLAKLRRHFNDPLLVRQGNAYTLSSLALHLKEDLPSALQAVERITTAQMAFDPLSSSREFHILGTDYATARVGAPLLRLLATSAPNIRIRFDHVLAAHVDGAPDSLRDVDGMFLPHGYLAQQPHLDVLTDEWACVVADGSPEEPTPQQLLESPWIMTVSGRGAFTPAARQLQIAGIDPAVTTITPNFFVIPALLEGSNKVALMPRLLAEKVVHITETLRIVPPPIPLSPISEAFWWHPDKEHEPAHRWLRQQMSRACEPLLASD
ncbi:LysR family transcriptional regulator [Arthrobacter sulfonylureivorans]|uniref:LysR family transcriptional regulator n=1 Tax=Arthrobacter sulfonylureivorans TaxID=2486855 RepID=A0ABY3WAU3_9MICC|nr:LysR family transcriptional regulator [Arthrobacter sulfonylureivorans]UNK45698.1 LysR family transcriptional regulator [Arthrobacter sulfonylureivorans]